MAIQISKADFNTIPVIRKLVFDIWPFAYSSILGKEQIDYMLQLIYSEDALTEQMNNGHTFIVMSDDEEPVAFADYQPLGNVTCKLHKLYALPSQQGKGLGRLIIDYITSEAKKNNLAALRLNVNRHNKAKAFYEHLGFKIIEEADIDIGSGYFMNDYIMEKKL